ncbi:hypothetical protein [Streptomyces sp. NPDC005281]
MAPLAALLAERLTAPRKSAKPRGVQTADWYALDCDGDSPSAA